MRQLEADVGVQMIGRNGIKNLLIQLRAVAGLVGIGNVLTKVVDAHAHARAIDSLRDPHGVGDFRSGNETPGYASPQRRLLGKAAQRTIFRKMDEEGPQHEVPATSK